MFAALLAMNVNVAIMVGALAGAIAVGAMVVLLLVVHRLPCDAFEVVSLSIGKTGKKVVLKKKWWGTKYVFNSLNGLPGREGVWTDERTGLGANDVRKGLAKWLDHLVLLRYQAERELEEARILAGSRDAEKMEDLDRLGRQLIGEEPPPLPKTEEKKEDNGLNVKSLGILPEQRLRSKSYNIKCSHCHTKFEAKGSEGTYRNIRFAGTKYPVLIYDCPHPRCNHKCIVNERQYIQ